MTLRVRTTAISLAAVAPLAVATASTAPAADRHPAPAYRLEQVGDLGGSTSFGLAIDGRGSVAGTARVSTELRPQLPWVHDGRRRPAPQALEVPRDSGFGRVLGLESDGSAAGEVFTPRPESSRAAWWDKRGRLTLLRGLGPTGSAVANDLNGRHDVVGASAGADGRVRAVVWRRAGEPQPLPWLVDRPGAVSRANAVTDSGVVVGSSTAVVAHDDHQHVVGHAVMWSHGRVRDLGALTPGGYSTAKAVAPNRLVVGEATLGDATRAVDLSRGSASALPQLGTWKHSTANGVNRRGQVVGSSSRLAGAPTYGGAATLWQYGRAYDLNTLTRDLPAGWTLVSANAINARGQIAGYALDRSGRTVAVRLTPTR